jgi:hypothetical protein
MRAALLSLGVSALAACGGKPSVNATFYVKPPPPGDSSCLGVAGFEVVVSSTRGESKSALVNPMPVLDPKGCAVARPFTFEELDVEALVTVTITGYDGAGVPRLRATNTMKNLHEAPVHLELQPTLSPPAPVLVVRRSQYLQGTPLSELESMLISLQMQSVPILSVDPKRATPYFDVEPGAYAVPDLAADGGHHGRALTVDFISPLQARKVRFTATWNMTGGYYDALPP